MKVCIILPTYNEKENISNLLENLLVVFEKNNDYDMNILVVDDNSPDGTQDVVKKFLEDKRVNMITGEKQGLGAAYIRGFRYAINNLKADVVFEMDADFSHKPNDIPRFLNEINNDYDFIIGSRYIPGGGTPDWDIIRKAISSSGNFFARSIAGLRKVHDCTYGYRAIRTDLIKKMDLNKIDAQGYSFQMNLLWFALKNNAKVKEIPIIFNDRNLGNSKMRLKDLMEFFMNSFKLRWGE